MQVQTWNSLIQLSIGLILALPTLYFQVQLVFVNGARISNLLRINMAMWVITSIFNILYTAHFLLLFRGEGTLYRVKIISIIGIIYFTLLTSVSLSVLFLLLDRCLIFILATSYEKSVKRSFEISCFVAVIGNFFIVFTSHLLTGLAPGEFTTCMSAGCLPNNNRNVISIAAKFGYGFCNMWVALIFAIMLIRFNKKQLLKNSITKKANFAAISAIVSELVCNIIPNLSVLVSFSVLHWGIIQSLGPYVNTLASLDGFFVTISYIKILGWEIRLMGWLSSVNVQKTISVVAT